jgi:hypothetical protein
MVGNSEFKWHGTDVQHLRIVAAEVVVVEDHEVEVEIADVRDLALAVDRVAAIEIAGAPTAAAVVALVRTARARAANHARAASLKTGRKTVVPNPGTELIEECARE